MKLKIYRNIALTLVCIILGVMVSWQYKSVNYNQKSVQQNYKRVEEVMDKLLAEKHKNELLSQRLDELNKEIEEYKNATNAYTALSKSLARAEMIAGLTDVQGAGVIVTLDNNVNENGYVDEWHILNVLNELRASDAQALSINDERIVAMSEVRQAGNFIMVNGRQMSPPFIIKAIADPDKLESSLTLLGGVKENLEYLYHIKVDIQKSEEIKIPAVRDDGTVIRIDKLMPVEN